ncbi:MAG: tetratricopeptide repeat protein, partial [Nitrosopumilaceae archaeon]
MNEIERLRKDKHGAIANQIKHCNRYQLNVLRSIIEFPNTTSEQLSTFIVLSELDSVDIKDLSSQKSYYNLLIRDLKGSILKEENGLFIFAGDQFDILYLKYHLFSNGITDFVFGRPDDPDMPVEYMLTKILLKDIPAYQSNTRFDRSVGIKEPEGRTTKKLSFGGKFPPKPGAKPGEWTTIFQFSFQEIEEKFYLGVPNSIRFRANIEFLNTGLVTQYIFENEEHVKLAKQRLESLKTKLELLGIRLILKDEISWTLEANKMIKEKNYKNTLEFCDEAIKINPEYELAWANKGTAYFLLEDYENALKCFKKWSDVRPGLPTPWEEQGKCFIHMKRPQEALGCLDKAVKLGPEVWSAWDNRGRALLNLKKFEEAIDSFDKAISLKIDDYDAMFFKGICLSKLERDKEALQNFDLTLQHKPDYNDALLNKSIS